METSANRKFEVIAKYKLRVTSLVSSPLSLVETGEAYFLNCIPLLTFNRNQDNLPDNSWDPITVV